MIPSNHTFACLAVEGFYRSDLSESVVVREGLAVELKPRLEFSQQWERWLGEIAGERLRNSRFIVLATAIPDPNDGGRTRSNLMRLVHDYFLAIALQGVPAMDSLLNLAGEKDMEESRVREAGPVRIYRYIKQAGPAIVTQSTIQRANVIERGIAMLSTHEYTAPTTPLYRLRLGLICIMNAFHERHLPMRVHHLVRSLEAVIRPDEGKTTKQFRHRCRTFVGGKDIEQVLEDIYHLRSAFEHLHMEHPPSFAGLSHDDQQRRSILRAYQVELIACHVYVRLLSDVPFMRAVFADEQSLGDFWRLPDGERMTKWGKQLDLDSTVISNIFLKNEVGSTT